MCTGAGERLTGEQFFGHFEVTRQGFLDVVEFGVAHDVVVEVGAEQRVVAHHLVAHRRLALVVRHPQCVRVLLGAVHCDVLPALTHVSVDQLAV